MSVFIGLEVLDALSVCDKRDRKTLSRLVSFACMAVFKSFLSRELINAWLHLDCNVKTCLIFRSKGGEVEVEVA